LCSAEVIKLTCKAAGGVKVAVRERFPVFYAVFGCLKKMTGQAKPQSELEQPHCRKLLMMRFTTFVKVGSGMSFEDYEWILYVARLPCVMVR
jgi:hypothetical protein